MIEFGAGGKVARREDAAETPGTGNDGTTAETSGEPGGSGATNTLAAAATGVAATTIGGRERRKKKGKGWFCPVCRQREHQWRSTGVNISNLVLGSHSVHLVVASGTAC
jgi:hypothetical protein